MLRTKLLNKKSKKRNREPLKRLEICHMKNSRAYSLIISRVVPLISVIDLGQLKTMTAKASKKVNSAPQKHPILMKKRTRTKETMVMKTVTGLSIMLTNLRKRLRVVKQDQRHRNQIDQEQAKREKQL